MKKLQLFGFLFLTSFVFSGCELVNDSPTPLPVAVSTETSLPDSDSSQPKSDSTDCDIALLGIDFDSELSSELITNDFLIELIYCKDIPSFLPDSFIIRLDNGNEVAITMADLVIYLVSYREQVNETANTSNPAWWSIALATIDTRTNSIRWEGLTEDPNGSWITEVLPKNPISH